MTASWYSALSYYLPVYYLLRCHDLFVNGMSYMELSDEECIEMIECDKNDDITGKLQVLHVHCG